MFVKGVLVVCTAVIRLASIGMIELGVLSILFVTDFFTLPPSLPTDADWRRARS